MFLERTRYVTIKEHVAYNLGRTVPAGTECWASREEPWSLLVLELDDGEKVHLGQEFYARGLEDNHKRRHLMALEGRLGAVAQIQAIEDDRVFDALEEAMTAVEVMET